MPRLFEFPRGLFLFFDESVYSRFGHKPTISECFLQNFPIPIIEYSGNHEEIYNYFKITKEEITYINDNL